jgi:hypothetical protein
LETVESENSEGHFTGVFKGILLQTISRTAREENESSVTAGAGNLLLNL